MMAAAAAAVGDSSCVFCRIAAKTAPAFVLLEAPACVAFLDLSPAQSGHALIIPRAHAVKLDETPQDALAACVGMLPLLRRHLLPIVGATGRRQLSCAGAAGVTEDDCLQVTTC